MGAIVFLQQKNKTNNTKLNNKMKTIAIAGTFDTKGREFLYLKGLIEQLGLNTYTINTGVFTPAFTPDVGSDQVAAAAGYDIKQIVERHDRALAMEALSKGMLALVPKLYKEGHFDGIISMGGSGGSSLVAPAMRALPLGVPKVLVSTMASGNVSQYVGTSDIIMMPSIVDVAGLNEVSKTIFRNAVLAVAGMVGLKDKLAPDTEQTKPLIAATMFGVTTPCVDEAKRYLEERGYEVLVFHCTGTGGRTMESLINAGYFVGVLDLTTTEWCDELVGGVLNAGPDRLDAAIKCKVPQVVSVGATDMVNFGPRDTVPAKFAQRNLYQHNPTVTLMRTTPDENVAMGRIMAGKWNKAEAPMVLMLPDGGVSMIDADGQPFEDKVARKALFDTLKQGIDNPNVEIDELDCNINDKRFAQTAAQKLLDLIEAAKK